jgi:hypothetical protein
MSDRFRGRSRHDRCEWFRASASPRRGVSLSKRRQKRERVVGSVQDLSAALTAHQVTMETPVRVLIKSAFDEVTDCVVDVLAGDHVHLAARVRKGARSDR